MVGTITKGTMPLALVDEQVTNGAKEIIESGLPYRVLVQLTGTAPILFHAWNSQAVAEKSVAAKGSKAKKTDDLETYVYRDTDGNLGIPGMALTACLAVAGKFRQDPRSPRKSAFDLVKAGIVPLTPVAAFEPARDKWEFEHACRVVIQRAAITRIRPAMREGWQASFELLVNIPEYLSPHIVAELLNQAGKLVGLLDGRPTYGRFTVTRFEILEA